MMSICSEVEKIVEDKSASKLDKLRCEQFEAASMAFECLVEKGVASRRGYQLLPIEDKVCIDIEVNYSKPKTKQKTLS